MHCKIVHIVFTVFTVRKAKKRLRWVGGRSSMTYLLRRGRDVKRKNLTESATTQITVIQTFISTSFNIYQSTRKIYGSSFHVHEYSKPLFV